MNYEEFITSKRKFALFDGIENAYINPMLFEYQRQIVKWALKKGRSAIFADCGMGKTFMQLEFARNIPGRVLILAPLAVADQTVSEGRKIGVEVTYARSMDKVSDGITITNYQMLGKFDCAAFDGVVLDESSIIKHFDGKFRNQIIDGFRDTKYKLACTATPAPNDHMELGNHAEFLGVMTRSEMLATYFVHDGGDTSKWRLKGHAKKDFWKWVCSWAVMIRKPSDLGFSDEGFELPTLSIRQITVEHKQQNGFLFAMEAHTLQERQQARRESVADRVKACADMVNDSDEPWLIWCNLNNEGDALESSIPDAVHVYGSDEEDAKARKLMAFSSGDARVLITKPSIAGFGMNWQHCRNVAFVGLSDSWEQYYQAVRRCWRFGQKQDVNVYIITSDAEGSVVRNIQWKEAEAITMAQEMVANMKDISMESINEKPSMSQNYARELSSGSCHNIHLCDCVELARELKDESVGFSIFSPPFASLYTYSASDRDMGNARSDDEFSQHFAYLVKEYGRFMMPGRLVAIHCFDIPSMKERDGVIGLKDFSNQMRIAFEREGFVYHSRVTIWKDPVTQMQRTKALGLLHKTIRKDSSMSRQGLPDYLIVMRKIGINTVPISHTHDEFPVDQWQKWASPVWMDINPSDTLQKESAREENDEKHICPLQLEVIRRAMLLWSAKGDLVFSPFTGIGSEGYVAIQNRRRFVGSELKPSYYRQAVENLRSAYKFSDDLFANI